MSYKITVVDISKKDDAYDVLVEVEDGRQKQTYNIKAEYKDMVLLQLEKLQDMIRNDDIRMHVITEVKRAVKRQVINQE